MGAVFPQLTPRFTPHQRETFGILFVIGMNLYREILTSVSFPHFFEHIEFYDTKIYMKKSLKGTNEIMR